MTDAQLIKEMRQAAATVEGVAALLCAKQHRDPFVDMKGMVFGAKDLYKLADEWEHDNQIEELAELLMRMFPCEGHDASWVGNDDVWWREQARIIVEDFKYQKVAPPSE